MLSRLIAVFAVVVVAFCCARGVAQEKAGRRPNVIVILSDDQGWGDLSVHGNTNLATPNIDSLAKDGALLERFFVCPVCSPTRAEFLTGRYHARGGVRGVSTGQERLNLDERTIAQTFKAAGYATGAFGKWHNGLQSPYHPNDRGFDEYYGFCSGHWGDYFGPPLEHNGKFVKGKGYITDDLTEHAIGFIEQHQQRPFVCYLPLNTPHSPMQVPDSYWDRFKDKELKLLATQPGQEDLAMTRAALAMCENIDWNVGRVLAKLGELKLAENTIVLYFADNGPNSFRWNGGMKGRKGSTDEGGVRSPLLIRWPGKIQPGTRVPQIAGAIDLLPTLADLAGVKVAGEKPLDGRSLKPLLTGAPADWADRTLVQMWNARLSVRTQQYRLDAAGGLFDMVADPGQTRDIAKERPEVAARLQDEAARWRKELVVGTRRVPLPPDGTRSVPATLDERPFTIGFAASTPLPARDGVPHGNVKRSDTAPNCSYFTNWTSTDDRITWDVEVGKAGRYEAVVFYTCPAADVGSTVELSLGSARVQTKVMTAHDPPLYGREHDRAPRRAESFMKDFQPLKLGEFDLPAGRGELALKALAVAGQQVMDVRYVVLNRVGDAGR
jgi:arylsulfatase A-like enzyme